MLHRTARPIGILFLAAMMLIAGAEADSDGQAKDATHKKASNLAAEFATRKSQEPSKGESQPVLQPVQSGDRETGIEDVEGREDWFRFQRRYPFDSIPDAARARAYQTRPTESLALQARTWQPIGPAPTTSAFPDNWGVTSGRVNTIAISPADSQIVLLGAATGGIWRSTDGGTSFSPTADDQSDLAVQSITFSASNPMIAYAGMGDSDFGYLGTGVLKSTDSGKTWARVNNATLPSPGETAKIEVDPANPDRVYLAQYVRLVNGSILSSGFYLSTDGGVNWTKTLPGLARDLVLNPANSQTLYLAMSRVDDGVNLPGLYRSTNGGSTWTRIYTTPYAQNATRDVAVAVTPADSQMIYVYTGGVLNNIFETRVEVSTNGGSSWTNRGSGTLDRAFFGTNTYIYADPTNANTVYAGTRDVFKSINGGVSWTNLTNNFTVSGVYTPFSSNTHPDQHALAFAPGSSSTFYIGNLGGIWKTSDSGATFSNLNASLSLTMFVGYAIHPTNAAISYGGTQSNGSQKRLNTTGQWREFISGNGGNCVIDTASPSTIFSTYIYGTVFRFSNNGDTFNTQVSSNTTFGESGSNPRIAFYPPFTGNGFNSNLYFGTWRLFISTTLGNSWSAPAGVLDLTKGVSVSSADVLSAIGVSRSNTDVIYTGSAQGRAMVSTNGGTSWTDITAGLPNRFITAVVVDPSNPAKAYLTVSGFITSHVFLTTDSGATWTDISGNLPDIPVNTLLVDPLNANVLYVGTDIGVFRSTTGGNTWTNFNSGLPPVIVNRLVAQSSGVIQAATYGRGAYELTNVATNTLTVASSSPSGGVSISVSPLDRNGVGSGVTQFNRVYDSGSVVTLTAPSAVGGNNFQKWQRDGVDLTTSLTTDVTMDANHTMTAIYLPPPGSSRVGLYWPVGGAFFFKFSNSSGPADYAFTFGPANQGWTPVIGDWDGDGIDTIGLYFPANGAFFIRNSNNSGIADIYITYGPAGQGWLPVIGDWDGNGTDTVGLYNPGNGFFYLRNSNTIGFADLTFGFGPVGQGWIPIVGDWDGDGIDTVGLYNPATGAVQLRNSNTTGAADVSFTFTGAGPTWKPIVGDWDGNGTSTLGLYDPATGVFMLRNSNTTGGADISITWAGGNYVPLAGTWQ